MKICVDSCDKNLVSGVTTVIRKHISAFFSIPLFTEFAILLSVCVVNSQQRLQAVSVRLHILVVNVDIIKLLLFLKYLLCSAYTHVSKAEV